MHKTVDVEDLLALAFQKAALKQPPEDVWFTEDPRALHRKLKDIRDRFKNTFPELDELTFSSEGAFPYSPEVRQILGNWQLDGVIARRNPGFDRFCPNMFADTGDVVTEELEEIFATAPQERTVFDEMVTQLGELVVPRQ